MKLLFGSSLRVQAPGNPSSLPETSRTTKHEIFSFCFLRAIWSSRIQGPYFRPRIRNCCVLRHSIPIQRASCCVADPGCLSQIPDPKFFHPGSRIQGQEDSGSRAGSVPIKQFLSSRKYDPGCSCRIRILIFYLSRIPDPGVKKSLDPGSRIRNTGFQSHFPKDLTWEIQSINSQQRGGGDQRSVVLPS